MNVRIIIDSTADMPRDLKERFTIVPMSILFGDAEYIDGVTIDHRSFYEKLIESDVLPTTSQPSPDAFAKVFEDVKQKGESAVVLTVSSKLSGTYQSACIAAQDYENVYIVDSKGAYIETVTGTGREITRGEYAAAEAKKALSLGMDVFIFSDNVTLEEEL